MAKIGDYNPLVEMEKGLLTTVKEEAINNIINKLVGEFKEKAEQEVRREVEKVTIKRIKEYKNVADLRNEIKVYCEWARATKK